MYRYVNSVSLIQTRRADGYNISSSVVFTDGWYKNRLARVNWSYIDA